MGDETKGIGQQRQLDNICKHKSIADNKTISNVKQILTRSPILDNILKNIMQI